MSLVGRAAFIASAVITIVARLGAAQTPTPGLAVDGFQLGAGTRWRVVKSPHYDVVFAEGLETDAQRVARMLERSREAHGRSMGAPPKRITVVLQHSSTISNGYVASAPRRSVYITAPPFFSRPTLLTTDDWLSLLAAHETRHVAQTDQEKTGFSRLAYTIVGDIAALLTLEVPGWVGEGDAVGFETAISEGGRGRHPGFFRELRVLALEDELPGYHQAVGGSYDHLEIDKYALGYLLTTRLKRTRPLGSVGRVVRGAARHAYLGTFSFPTAMKREAGVWPGALYDSTMREATALWRAQLEGLTFTPATRLSPAPSVVTSYLDPHVLADGSIVALREGQADVTQLVRLDSGRVTVLAEPYARFGMRAAGTIVTWTQWIFDSRWGWRDDMEIRALDVSTGRQWRVGKPARYAFPIASPDGGRVAAVEVPETGGSRIVVLDARTGARLRAYDVPAREHAMDVAWRGDGGALVFSRQGVVGKALTTLDLATGSFTDLIPHGRVDVYRPVFAGPFVLHVSTYSGIENVYAIDTRSGARWQVTSRRIEARAPAVSQDNRRLLFSELTPMGDAVMEMPLDSAAWTPIEKVERRPFMYHEPMVAQEQFVLPTAEIAADSTTRYPVSSYRRPWRLFDAHSWYPHLFDGDRGYTVASTDVLNTLASTLSYRYNTFEKASAVKATASYGGFYPIIDLSGTVGTRSTTEQFGGETVRNSWREKTVSVGLRVPLDLSRGYWGRGLSIGAHVERSDVTNLTPLDFQPPGVFTPVTLAATVGQAKATAPRDLGGWSQFLQARYRYTPFDGDYHPRAVDVHASVGTPGLFRHDALRLGAAVEDHRADNFFRFGSSISPPRGYGSLALDRHVFKGTADYAFPIAHPDVTIPPLLYVRRVYGNLFYDRLRMSGLRPRTDLSSAGIELIAESAAFGTEIPVSVGARWVYRSTDEKWVTQFIFRSLF